MQLMVPGPPVPNNSKSRVKAREEARLKRAQEAMEQSHRFRSRERPTLVAKVEAWKKKLAGRNVIDTISLIESQPDAEREIALLAEEFGQGRKSVLARWRIRKTVREAYLSESGAAAKPEPAKPAPKRVKKEQADGNQEA